MAIVKTLLDQLLAGREPQDLFAKGGLIDDLKKALSERMLAAELGDHLESENKQKEDPKNDSNECHRALCPSIRTPLANKSSGSRPARSWSSNALSIAISMGPSFPSI